MRIDEEALKVAQKLGNSVKKRIDCEIYPNELIWHRCGLTGIPTHECDCGFHLNP